MPSAFAIRGHFCLFLVLIRFFSLHALPTFIGDASIGIVPSESFSKIQQQQQQQQRQEHVIDSIHTSSVELCDLTRDVLNDQNELMLLQLRGGGGLIPAGWNPFGYAMTSVGEEFLQFDGSLDSDIGRFVASLKSSRKTTATIKETWLEIVRVSKTGQSMRIYRKIDEIIAFCLKVGLID